MADRYANSYHGRKNKFLGNEARVAPAWRDQAKARTAPQNGVVAPKSKILLSSLPPDVSPEEVHNLFMKTVGPVQEAFIVYNSQGKSKGMAVVAFHNAESALVARQKYNGKIIDGRRPIKIEIIKDEDDTPKANGVPHAAPSLLQRIAGPKPIFPAQPQPAKQPNKKTKAAPAPAPAPVAAAPRVAANPAKKQRRKKGPKRVKKTVTVADLDAEMEDYRAQAAQDV
ncbi:RNA recognition motif (RRM) domain-containing protein [Phanerochaete sordida]|uniref:RNA recognition motif (RRM) domain-containing protein n=1 Tax=Phanerochaete sordida TaxID=48140 RepID=A0A9P3FXW8_9APHY|nr:RNA recognition motif (RRM) domain-containing protein [Phanerochaete sordida]